MEKNSMELLEEALAILKAGKQPDLAYAKFTGYAIAAMDLKSAQMLLEVVKENN